MEFHGDLSQYSLAKTALGTLLSPPGAEVATHRRALFASK